MSEWIVFSRHNMPYGEDRLLLVRSAVDGNAPFMCVGYMNRITRCWCINGEMLEGIELDVTHWMPLPEPPEVHE